MICWVLLSARWALAIPFVIAVFLGIGVIGASYFKGKDPEAFTNEDDPHI